MACELAYVLINPYPIRKSRTGGIIARYLARTDLRIVGTRMYGPSNALAQAFSRQMRGFDPNDPGMGDRVADYVLSNYTPDAATGRPHRTMLLLFEGEDAIQKIRSVTGCVKLNWGSGLSVRDTYGDFVLDHGGHVRYFEPAVLVAESREQASASLRLWVRHMVDDSGLVRGALDIPQGQDIEQTLVLLKPDNFRHPSLRAGNIVDLLSSSGLRMVAVKRFAMSVAQAEAFYAPVKASLRRVFPSFGAERVAQALSREFGFAIEPDISEPICAALAPLYAERQFEDIIEFMTGRRPGSCEGTLRQQPGNETCLAIVYEGPKAVSVIRELLGATDPRKARPGSVRREFGANIMVNAAHASDSPENARREIQVIDVARDEGFKQIIERYYGTD